MGSKRTKNPTPLLRSHLPTRGSEDFPHCRRHRGRRRIPAYACHTAAPLTDAAKARAYAFAHMRESAASSIAAQRLRRMGAPPTRYRSIPTRSGSQARPYRILSAIISAPAPDHARRAVPSSSRCTLPSREPRDLHRRAPPRAVPSLGQLARHCSIVPSTPLSARWFASVALLAAAAETRPDGSSSRPSAFDTADETCHSVGERGARRSHVGNSLQPSARARTASVSIRKAPRQRDKTSAPAFGHVGPAIAAIGQRSRRVATAAWPQALPGQPADQIAAERRLPQRCAQP